MIKFVFAISISSSWFKDKAGLQQSAGGFQNKNMEKVLSFLICIMWNRCQVKYLLKYIVFLGGNYSFDDILVARHNLRCRLLYK